MYCRLTYNHHLAEYLNISVQARVEEEACDEPVAELQREVEDLKLRLHMAAEHYKEKYKECQRLQRQVSRLSEQQQQQGVGQPHKPPASELSTI